MTITDNKKSIGSRWLKARWGWGIGAGMIFGVTFFLVTGFFYHKRIDQNCAREGLTQRQQQDKILRDAINQELEELEQKHQETLQAFAVLAQEARLQSQRLRELRTLTQSGADKSRQSR